MVERKAGWSDFISILSRLMTVFVAVMLLSGCDGGQPTEDIDPVPPVVILPSNTFVLPSTTQNLNVGGGTPPYQYTIMSGAGSIDASTGLFTASAVPGSTVIRVQDPNNLYATTTVTVVGPVVLSPATGTVGTGGTLSLTASSGRPPYAYSIKSGGGSMSSTGVFTAPSLAGATVVQVTDAFGQTATANLTTTTALSISPLLKTVLPGTTQTFTSAGGTSPHVFSLVSGGGTINPTTGIFLAPTTPGTSVVRVTDANGLRAEGSITVASPVSISPASATLAVNNSKVFAANGGVAPYTFSILSGGGTINPNSGAYTAPLTTGTVQVRVTDSLGQYATTTITINPPLSISPDPVTVVRGGSQLFNAGGGVPPYVYSVATGGGSINGSTGAYVAPSLAGSATVKVTDSFGNTAVASITILPPVTITPTSLNLVASKTTTFAAAGGEAPYTFSIVSGGGSINSATGYFTAPPNASSVIVRVTDNRGQTANATVTVIATLGITPPSAAMLVSTTKAFSWIGGLGPYTFSVASGGGSINATNGVFTAPASAGSVTVRVADSMSQTADALVVVAAPLAISPTTAMLAVNTNKTFLPVGGLPPHTFSVVAGGGSINSTTGVYTAPSTSGNATVRVMDALGQAATANVIIAPPLALLPDTVTLAPTEGVTFAAWGGVPPYSYAVLSGLGSIGSVTGAYMAPGSAGLDMIQVTDAQGNTATAAVTITAPISISPASLELAINNESTFSASGGKPPYAFAVTNGSGSINASSGLYVAPGMAGSETITVTDSLGQSASATVTVNEGLTLSPLNPKVIQNSLTNFSASGGVAPYIFSVEAGGGVVDVNTGVYTSPSVATNVTVRVTDSLGNFSETSVTVAELIAITPTSLTMAVNNQSSFASAGGLAPISFSVTSGDGVIDSVTGAFTAGSSSGTVVVQVEDSIGQKATATVTVNPALSLTPVTLNMIQNGGANFTANNGVPPYSFTVLSGGGVIDSATGEFISPNSSGEVTIRVTDSWENVADSTVTVYPAVNISPTTLDVVVSQDSTFAATGGLAPYVYSIQSGGGAIDAATGVFTAPAAIGSVTLKVTDSLGQIAQATVNVVDTLSLSPAAIVMAVNTQNTFSAVGGLAPYAFTVISGGGVIDGTAGTYTAPATEGTATVQVTDGVGQSATATVTITPQLSLSPSASTLAPTEGMLFTAAGGVTPYSYAVISGGGLVSATTGLFAAPAHSDFVIVQVTDAQGSTATSTVTVTDAISITPTSMALAILNTGDFSAAGGKPPYSYSVVSGLGSIDHGTGLFSSGGVSGSAVVRVTDSLGQSADATVTINPALTISPANLDIVQNADAEFSAAGGVGPYTFSVVSGGGTVDALTGAYHSPSTAGTVTVRATDSLGNIANASVNVVDPVLIAPSAVTLAVGNSASFTASGGLPPFAYTVVAGGGSIGSASGVYNAPFTSGTATVRVSDALGQIAEATVTINPALSITPSSITLPASGSQSFVSMGGVPPLTYSVVNGTGSIDAATGVYVGPSSADSVTVRVTDSLSNTADAQVTILNNVLISPANLNIVRNGTTTFTATEGQTPYTFSVLSGGGSIGSGSGEFVAPGDAGVVVVKVTDNLGQVASANVNVVSAIQISPSTLAMVVGTEHNFSASGGLAPYSYSVVSGDGSVAASTGVFSASSNAGTVTVRVTDALGQSADASVNVVPVLTVSPTVLTMAVNTTESLSGSGGLVPYVYSVISGGGSINAATGSYSSSSDPGAVTLRVTDALGQIAETSVTVTPKLSLLPATITLAPVESQMFAASGGVTPYSYSIVTGGGSIGLATGAFVGPTSSGTVNIRVTDAQGSTADSVVTVSAAISVSPSLVTLAVSNTQTFAAAGGKPPYAYEVLSGGGSIGSSNGIYTAPGSAGTAIVKVTDSLGQSAQANVNINSALSLSPSTLNIAQSGSATFSASGGVESYVFSVASGGGQIDSATGVFTAPSSAGSVTIRVTDSRGNTANATVTVLTPVVISPSSIALAVGNSETFTASGGITPYSFAILSGDGSVDATTGQYTAPAAAGSAKVRVTDGIGQVSSADITIHPALAIAASQSVLPASGSATFSATGGVVPYEFSVVSGGGSVNSSTGVYSAPASASSVTVKVTDSRGNTASVIIAVKDPVSISPSSITLAVNNSTTFAVSGGLAPFTYSVLSGGGTVGSSTGVYVAPASAGNAVVRVIDALGQAAQASLTINPALSLSPAAIDVVQMGSVSFSASGGVTPYTYSVVSGGGSINGLTGVYTAPSTAGSVVVKVTDSLGNIATSSVTVATPVQISPVNYTLAVTNQKTFTASGGLAPYTFAMVSGVGSITTAGVYTAPGTSGVATVKVTDSLGQVASADLTINAALSLSPSTLTMAQSSSATFAASGGVSPYSYSLVSGGGSINGSSGVFTSPASAGSVAIRVSDSLGNTANATVTVVTPVTISPTTVTLAVNNAYTFVGAGGQSPFTYSIVSGGGSINSSSGVFTAPASAGSSVVRVTDAIGQTASATITVNPALGIAPSTLNLSSGGTQTFAGTNGVSPYSYSVVSGGGSINSSTGAYTAPAAGSAVTIRVTDLRGNTADASVSVKDPVVISPKTFTLAVNNSKTFSVSGGLGPFAYALVSGGGSIDASTGVFTAPAASGTTVIKVTDSLGQSDQATITINPALNLSPNAVTLVRTGTTTFTASGGVTAYTYSVVSGGGSINSSTGAFTAPATAGTVTVRVTDQLGNTADGAVTVLTGVVISPASITLAQSGTTTFSASGGRSPYTYSIVSGGGSINSSTGAFTGPATPATVNVRVTDSFNQTADATVTVVSPVQISPTNLNMVMNGSSTFTGSGGSTPYTFSVVSGLGSIGASSGIFASSGTSGAVVVRLTDAIGQTAESSIQVVTAATITPISVEMAINTLKTFTASGGLAPYTYSIASGGGTINSATGVYTAPATSGSAVVRVTDSLGQTASGSVTINPALGITPSSITLAPTEGTTFTGTGGVAPYSYSVISGGGSVGTSTGAFVAPTSASVVLVRVTDAQGSTATASVTVTNAISISPTTKILAVNNAFTFTAAGGKSPYIFALVSGGGSINSTSGLYTAGGVSGTTTVKVTDSLNQSAQATITVNPAVTISPNTVTLAQNGTTTFVGAGGVSPYTFSILSGGGTVNTTSGAFTAPSTAGTVTVRITDSLGNTANATVNVITPVVISPSTLTLAVNNTYTFNATGGQATYTYSLVSGSGSITAAGVYTASSATGSAIVQVTDAIGQTSQATITINPALTISPSTLTIAANGTHTFTSSGGATPYTFSIVSGGGTINSSTGVFTAPASAATVTVKATDARGNIANATVSVINTLTISPTSVTLSVNNSLTFSATGGLAPLSYSVVSGGGSIVAATGVYTAPAASGTATVRVTDAIGQTSQSTVTINPALSLSPSTISLVRSGTTTFTASGGVTSYTYSIVSGGGAINSTTGAFTAPATAGSVAVRVTDSLGNTANSTVTVLTGVVISPASITLAQSGTTTFSASGGQSPYTYSIVSGGGSINSSTGVFTAPSTPGSVTVKVTDSYSQTSNATVTIVSPAVISPTTLNMATNRTYTFTGSGGQTPYSYSVVSGLGSINSSTGLFTSGASSGSVTVRLTDAIGQTSNATVTVATAVTISPASTALAVNTVKVFSASGGLSPYTYSVTAGGGSINSSSGSYTAPSTSGTATVQVTDSLGQTASASVTINPALGITPSSITLAPTEGTTFTGTGGVTPYSYSVISGGGSIGASTGAFVAPSSASVVLVQVTDAQGSTATASATITNAISISPTSKTLAVNNTATFTAAGGKSAYTFSLVSGGGSINATSGVYTAGATSGSAVVKVTDSLNQSAQATITINPALSLSPTAITLAQNATTTFTATGGVSPYTYSILSGSGTLNSSTGAFTAPAAAGSVSVRVTDSLGNTANSTVTVVSPVVISPTSITLAVNNTYTFTATGGQTSYTYSLVSGVGSINSSTGVYTAPASTGSAVVRVTDAIGQTSQATITINPALTISPSTVTLAANASQSFTGSGGATPYTYSVVSGGGSINSSSGAFTAPSSAATVTVRVTDARNNTANATVTVINTLVISPSTITLAINNTYTFTSTGGLAPLTYSLVSGGGSVNASTGAYTAPATTGSAVVRVTDSIGQTSQANVTINPALSISPASITISPNGTTTFTGAGGATPYTFVIVTGGGTINSTTGAFTAPATTGNVTVRVTDARSNSADASVIVETPVTISPSSITLAVNNTYTFTATGGRTPYSYALVSGTGAINSSSGLYTAPVSSGSAVVKVTDAVGQISTASITVNSALSISPTSSSLVVNGTRTFTASGGVSPYTYSIVSGGGTINSSTGAFTAPASAATVSVRVTDARSNTANATVTVVSSVTISPSNLAMAINNTYTFTAIGGQTPYTYSVVSGVGSVNSSSGLYSAGTTTGSAQVRVTDALGQTSTATVTVNPVLKISPTTLSIYANNQNTFNGLDGAAPYSFSLVSGTGTINSVSGVYTAPASAGSATVRVTDARGNTANATITILDTLTISPTSANVLVNSTLDFNSTGGQAPVTFSILSGSGSINSGTGIYTAGASADSTVIVKVTDANNATASASVNVYTALTISPTSITLTPNDLYTFAASGGVGTKTFSVFSGGGSINGSTGAYTAPSVVGSATIRVTDSIGNTASSAVTMNPDVQISPTTLTISVYQTYQFSSTNGVAPITYSVSAGGGSINSSGLFTAPSTAGTSTVRVSDARGNISDATVTVIMPTKIYAGGTTSCALFNNGSIKCWGNGANGQMGTGTTGSWGDVAGEMGNALPTINLGTGRTVKDLSVGANHICAILDTNALKCWGLNTNGQLGIGTTTTMGDSANEMGDSLPQINLGAGLTALKVAVGVSHTCAILNTGALKCWGLNTYGQLGLGNTSQLTAPSATAISLGTGRTAKSVALGQHHTCAILDNNTLKCWGGNLNGQLGLGITTTNHKGDGASEMGDLLAAVNLGTGRTALQVTTGYAYTCALLDNSTVKCWGLNTSGQLGMGNTTQLSSPSATAVSLGTSLVPSKILSHNTSNCVLFTNGLIKCWGSGTSGGLGIGSTGNIGSAANQMGDLLAYTQIGTGLTMTDMSRGWFGGCALTSTNRVKCWGNATSGFLGSGSTTLHLGDAAGEMGDTLPFVGL